MSPLKSTPDPDHQHEKNSCCDHPSAPFGLDQIFGSRTELIFACLSAGSLMIGWGLSWLTSVPTSVSLGFYALSYFFGGFFATLESIQALQRRRFEIDFLMVVAALGAGALGQWAEGALLLVLFSLGHALEHYAMGRARKSMDALGKLRPKTAIVLRDGQPVELDVTDVRTGDIVIVRPDSAIAADGVIISGESGVDQSPITGESIPVEKSPADGFDPAKGNAQLPTIAAEHRVFAGTINGPGTLHIWVSRTADDSTLSRLMKMVTEAESQRSPTQRLTDRFERYFVPFVLCSVVILLFAYLIVDEPFSASFYRAMAVLVAASPCALAIATPSAVLSAVARGGHGGVLFKGGGPLELLGSVDMIAFDKTGTLTCGKPKLTDILPAPGVTDDRLLGIAAAVERLSAHPLARAIVTVARERLGEQSLAQAEGLTSFTGKGVQARLNGALVSIGTESLFDDSVSGPLPAAILENVEQLEQAGRTTMIVCQDREFLGVLGMMDTPREAAKPTIAKLRDLGVQRLIMLSGDNQVVASQIAQSIGLDEAIGDLMPEDKMSAIQKWSATQTIAMVGDGVNDAPAMATAAVAIAMGAAGSDVALETADVALMGDDLSRLPFAVGLSRQTSRIIRQNLWISLGMIAILVPATILGLNLAAAVVFHEGSTVVVVINALRLLGYRDRLSN